MDRAKKFNILPYLMLLPSVLIMAVVVIYPILSCVADSFVEENGSQYGLGNYTYFFQDPAQLNNILYTLKIVILTVVFSITVAYFLAIYLRFSNTAVSRMIGRLYMVPRFVPGLVAVNSIITFIRDSGFLNRVSHQFGADWKLGLMYNESGIILMNIWFNIPFATMILAASLANINDSEIEAARDVGAGRARILTKMILPLTYKDLFVTATFVFMSNISSFTTPYLMGTAYPSMMGVSLYTLYNNQHYGLAAALSVIMFLLSSISAVVYIYVNMREDKWEGNR